MLVSLCLHSQFKVVCRCINSRRVPLQRLIWGLCRDTRTMSLLCKAYIGETTHPKLPWTNRLPVPKTWQNNRQTRQTKPCKEDTISARHPKFWMLGFRAGRAGLWVSENRATLKGSWEKRMRSHEHLRL